MHVCMYIHTYMNGRRDKNRDEFWRCSVRDRVFLEIESAVIRDPVMP